MFARVIEFTPKMEKKDELIKTVRQEVLPILKKPVRISRHTAARSGDGQRESDGHYAVDRKA